MTKVLFWSKALFTPFNNSKAKEYLTFNYNGPSNFDDVMEEFVNLNNDSYDGPPIFDKEIEKFVSLIMIVTMAPQSSMRKPNVMISKKRFKEIESLLGHEFHQILNH